MAIEVRMAEDEVDAVIAYRGLKQMHGEGGIPGTFDDLKVLTNVLRMVKGPGSVVFLAMDGDELAGVLPLWEQGYWYSTDRHLIDKGFYVVPAHRGGEAGKLLLEMAKRTADDTGLPIFITIFNGRRRRGGRSDWERLGATLGYHPQGAVLAHFPETNP